MATQRYAMAVKLKDEKREYYIENHANVWPEILDELGNKIPIIDPDKIRVILTLAIYKCV